MLESITLANFKGIAESQEVPLAPITLLFGANSSGKTSILQSLLLLKQTLDESESADTVLLPKGRTIDLGNYKELIHAHETSRELSFGFRLSADAFRRAATTPVVGPMRFFSEDVGSPWCTVRFGGRGRIIRLRNFTVGTGMWNEFLASFGAARSRARQLPATFEEDLRPGVQRALRLTEFNPLHPFITSCWKQIESSVDEYKERLADRHLIEEKRHQRIRSRAAETGSEFDRKRLDSFRNRLAELKESAKRFEDYSMERLALDIEKQTRELTFPLRNFVPQTGPVLRRRIKPAGVTSSVDPRQDRLLRDAHMAVARLTNRIGMRLIRILDRIIYLGPLREYPERHYIFSGNVVANVGKSGKFMPDLLFSDAAAVDTLNDWLERFDLGYKVSVKSLKDPHIKDVFTIRLIDASSGVSVSPSDVGFGISQILPILVQAIIAKNRMILVEQPEIHLHPRLQAEFGSFLADCIKPTGGNQFLIETHSEHLVLRLQRLIREKQLSPSDVSVIYVKKTSAGVRCEHLGLDERGEFFDEWPDGFFPERLSELI